MTIKTRSKFYYGHVITSLNNSIDFDEGGTPYTATLNARSYSLTEFIIEVERAMNAVGGQIYTVTLDRDTRIITITAPGSFDLLAATGPTVGTSAFPLMGFSAIDLTGLLTYDSQGATGFAFVPQFFLQDFVDFIDFQDAASASVSESAEGLVQVTSFGDVLFMECNIKYITDLFHSSDSFIENNQNAVSEARSFMQEIVKKSTLEFIPDRDDASVFTKCILDSTALSKSGTGFRLYEMMKKRMNDRYETKKLTFRKVS